MLKTHWRVFSRFERLADNAIIVSSFFLAYALRDVILRRAGNLGMPAEPGMKVLAPVQEYLILLFFAIPIYNASLSFLGAYRSMRLSSAWQIMRATALSGMMTFLFLGTVLFSLKLDLSRSFVAIFCALSAILLFVERVTALQLLRFFRVRGKNFRNVLIVGTGEQARRLYLGIVRQPELGVRVVGFVSLAQEARRIVNAAGPATSQVYDLPARLIANPETFEAALKQFAVDEVLFTEVSRAFSVVEDLAQIAVEEGVSVSLAADFFSLEIVRSEISYFGEFPLIHYRPTPEGSAELVAKRLFDIVISVLLLTLLSPILVLSALLIKATSTGPIFFRQRRVGLNGRIFTLLKFRSMIENAEELLPSLRGKNEMEGPVFKMKDDPRVTTVGRFMRRFSIDELPQLINVLRAEMSLVGPRPPLPEEVSNYERKQRRRLSMRPGITCTWQVSGRNDISDFQEWAKLDLEYIDNWSLAGDLKLLLRTVPAVLTGSGAR